MSGCGTFSREDYFIHILADTLISFFRQNIFYVSGGDITGIDTFYVVGCRRRSKLYNIGIMVEDGEHIGEGIQYPGAVFIAKTLLGRRRKMGGKKIYLLF